MSSTNGQHEQLTDVELQPLADDRDWDTVVAEGFMHLVHVPENRERLCELLRATLCALIHREVRTRYEQLGHSSDMPQEIKETIAEFVVDTERTLRNSGIAEIEIDADSERIMVEYVLDRLGDA